MDRNLGFNSSRPAFRINQSDEACPARWGEAPAEPGFKQSPTRPSYFRRREVLPQPDGNVHHSAQRELLPTSPSGKWPQCLKFHFGDRRGFTRRPFRSRRTSAVLGATLAALLACLAAWGGSDENTPTTAPGKINAKEPRKERPPVKLPDWKLYSAGKYTFERHCAVCHGRKGDGHGEEEWTLAFTPRPRSFQEGLFKYRSTPWDKLPTNADLKRTIRGGRSNTAMGMFTNLGDRELDGVVEYIKFFSKRWRDPENYAEPVKLEPQPDWFRNEAERKQRAAAGMKLFEIACVSCHGPAGDGKGAAAPTLVNVWGQKATPADLRQPHLRSGNTADDIYRVLMTGLNGTPMLSFADAFTPEQKWELVAHVLELRRKHESKK